MTYIFNGLRIFLAIIFVAGGLAYLELSLFKQPHNPLGWTHFLIAAAIVGFIAACWWDEKAIEARLGNRAPRTETLPDGTVMHYYNDGTRIEWKGDELIAFHCGDSPSTVGLRD